MDQPSSLFHAYARHKPGDTVHLTVQRPGRNARLSLTAVFGRRSSGRPFEGFAERFAWEIRSLYPIPFVTVSLTVLFLRLPDPRVWILSLLLASLAATPGFPNAGLPPALERFATIYKAFFVGLLGALFYFFFAVFPTRAPLDRRLPWLKWAALTFGLLFGGDTPPLSPLTRVFGAAAAARIVFWHIFTFLTLGMVCLAGNYVHAGGTEARRRIRVIFWGTGIGITPSLVREALQQSLGLQPPGWLSTLLVVLLFLFPLSFAYAVIKHRVLEIPVLLRRSARYLLVQRGFTFLLSLLSIGLTLLFALSFARYFQPAIEAAQPAGIALGAMFGTVLL
jgi:sigma-B regulation protein RsbU (phosphoserine phosphatase)